MDGLLQEITIYHKTTDGWNRYNLNNVSVRNTSIQNRNNTGVSNVDSAVIRIFDIDGYNKDWFVSKGDVIVNKNVNDSITSAPMTELREKYGEENCYQISSIDVFIYKDLDTKELQHVKIGAR